MKYELNAYETPVIRRSNQCFYEIPSTGCGYTTAREFERGLKAAHKEQGAGRIEYHMITLCNGHCQVWRDFG